MPTDSSKVFFLLITGMGDPFFNVNIDRTNRTQLNCDGISSEFSPIWINDNRAIFIREEVEKN